MVKGESCALCRDWFPRSHFAEDDVEHFAEDHLVGAEYGPYGRLLAIEAAARELAAAVAPLVDDETVSPYWSAWEIDTHAGADGEKLHERLAEAHEKLAVLLGEAHAQPAQSSDAPDFDPACPPSPLLDRPAVQLRPRRRLLCVVGLRRPLQGHREKRVSELLVLRAVCRPYAADRRRQIHLTWLSAHLAAKAPANMDDPNPRWPSDILIANRDRAVGPVRTACGIGIPSAVLTRRRSKGACSRCRRETAGMPGQIHRHRPGATVSICPLCGWEYEHPPNLASYAAELGLPGAVDLLYERRVENALWLHGRNTHGAETRGEFLAMLRAAQPSAGKRAGPLDG